jgi:hypothetical protein
MKVLCPYRGFGVYLIFAKSIMFTDLPAKYSKFKFITELLLLQDLDVVSRRH